MNLREKLNGLLHSRRTWRIVRHILFWLIAYLFFISFFGRANRDYQSTLVFASMLFPVAIATSYFLNYYLIPRFLFTKRYFRFALFSFYTLVITTWLETMITMFTLIIVSDYQVSRMDPASFDVVFMLVGFYFIILGASSIKIIQNFFDIKQQNRRLDDLRLQAEIRLKEAELKLLRAQIHPHFLFNTLNNLYGLTLEKSELAPELVLKLADLMDYMLYRCNQPLVPLESEILHLKNYIDIERLRYDGDLDLQFLVEGKTRNYTIAPMLLLPLIENAFKHGVSKSVNHPFVHIRIHISEHKVQLQVKNSCSVNNEKQESYTGGIGLQNLQKRLHLLYPEQHAIDYSQHGNYYRANLQLQLEPQQTLNGA